MKIKVTQLNNKEIEGRGIPSWPIWTCEVSEFDWEYDERESCFLLDGEVEVEYELGNMRFGAGDFVVFPKGLKCRWKVTKAVQKHYAFG